jgi:glycosyltransferase involved in cell wall biosynthesis
MGESQPSRLRVAAVGVTETATSGMRDYATLLADALGREGIECSLHWLQREVAGLSSERRQVSAWCAALRNELAREQPAAVVLHYSPFAYAHRGVPLHLPGLLAAVAERDVALIAVLHEMAYPWHRSGMRGAVWAVSQRAALIELMRRTRAAVVTTPGRGRWVESRRWLPKREVEVAPVFSNLPAPAAAARVRPGSVGLFGYGYEGARMEVVLDAVRLLADRGSTTVLRLLGAPGPDSEGGRRWREAAARRSLDGAVEFSGVLPAEQLAGELAACEILLSAVVNGPTTRKGTIAASLQSGRPLLALDGPNTWRAFTDEQALMLAPAEPEGLARAIATLQADGALRERLGAGGRAFAERNLSLAGSARVLAGLIERATVAQTI